jgi:hypothetical protein
MAKKSPKFQVQDVCNISYVIGVPRKGHTCAECGELEAELLVSHVVADERFTERLCEPCASVKLGTPIIDDDGQDDIVFVDGRILERSRPTAAYRS